MRIKKLFTFTLLLVFMLSTTSCVSIISKIFFNKDGGGTYTFTMDFSQMEAMGPGFKERLIEDMEKDSELAPRYDEMGDKLKGMKGISEVKTGFDTEKLNMYLTFSFEDVAALNAGMSKMFEKSGLSSDLPFFEFDGKTLKRTSREQFGNNGMSSMSSIIPGEVDPEKMEQMKEAEEMMAPFFRDSYMGLVLQF